MKVLYPALFLSLVLLSSSLLSCSSYKHEQREKELSVLDSQYAMAVLKKDTVTLKRLVSNDVVLYLSAIKEFSDFNSFMTLFRKNYALYSVYTHQVKKVVVLGKTGLVMGVETARGNVGETINVSYTDTWVYRKRHWQMMVRQY